MFLYNMQFNNFNIQFGGLKNIIIIRRNEIQFLHLTYIIIKHCEFTNKIFLQNCVIKTILNIYW
jgi:hypothetical protein